MSAKTFKEMYKSLSTQSPKGAFIERIAEVTKRAPATVRMWLCDKQSPDKLAKEVISKELNIPVSELWPE